MAVLATRFCKIFGEKVMLLFNRSEVCCVRSACCVLKLMRSFVFAILSKFPLSSSQDPLAKLPHARETKSQPHATLKLFLEIFSSTATGHQFLYTNDLHVLVEVLLRELTDQNQQTDEVCGDC